MVLTLTAFISTQLGSYIGYSPDTFTYERRYWKDDRSPSG